MLLDANMNFVGWINDLSDVFSGVTFQSTSLSCSVHPTDRSDVFSSPTLQFTSLSCSVHPPDCSDVFSSSTSLPASLSCSVHPPDHSDVLLRLPLSLSLYSFIITLSVLSCLHSLRAVHSSAHPVS